MVILVAEKAMHYVFSFLLRPRQPVYRRVLAHLRRFSEDSAEASLRWRERGGG